MAAEQIHPAAEPIRLPEFGNIEFGWGACRNSMCPNFGILYGSEEGPGSSDLRYGLINEAGDLDKLKCRACGMTIALHSTTALREIARHFLSLSLPFADCPDDDCKNHGVNAFEFFGRRYGEGKASRRPYRSARQHELTCKACGKSFPLGVALQLRTTRKFLIHSKRVLHSVSMGRPISDAINSGLKATLYYTQMKRMGERLRDYVAYRNAHLLRPRPHDRDNETALVYTDVMFAPLKRSEEGRYKGNHLRVIVSAVKLKQTYYVIAAHPYFLPDAKCPGLKDLEADKEQRSKLEHRWDALETFLDEDASMVPPKKGKASKNRADEGQPGQLIVSPYAEAAHFLVVDRMLSRFGRRFYYMDTSQPLFDSATAAMRDGIRRGRVQVVLYQHGSTPRQAPDWAPKGDATKPRTKTRLRRLFTKSDQVFAKRADELASKLSCSTEEARRTLWREARIGGYSEAADGTWLPYPPDYNTYRYCRTFWMTRRATDTVEDGMDLLMNASMHSVDSAHQSMRSRARGLQRRHSTSKGKGLAKNYFRADVMCAELWVYLFFFNYYLFPRDERTVLRAVPMGLAEKRARKLRPHDIAWRFRLGIQHAKEISQWLRWL